MPNSREVEITEKVVLLGRLMPAALGWMEVLLRSHLSGTLIASWARPVGRHWPDSIA